MGHMTMIALLSSLGSQLSLPPMSGSGALPAGFLKVPNTALPLPGIGREDGLCLIHSCIPSPQ